MEREMIRVDWEFEQAIVYHYQLTGKLVMG
jgi:hypothetical protein